MARRLVRTFLWLLGGTFIVLGAAYLALLIANRHDRAPAPEIAVVQALHGPADAIDDGDNSYLVLLGFAGPPDGDPQELGLERYRWMQSAAPDFDRANDPLGTGSEIRAPRSRAAAEASDACRQSALDCVRAIETNPEAIEQWLSEDDWLLERYRALIAMTAFSEPVPFELVAPSPSYGVVFDAQRLHMADAWLSAARGDVAAVLDALDADLTYWRMVLANSDALVTKMIAAAAIEQHFKRGNLVQRRLQQSNSTAAGPASWRAELSREERSMRRALAGEWAFFDRTVKETVSGDGNRIALWVDRTDSPPLPYAAWRLLAPFWQPQDLSNRYARLILDVSNALSVPYEDIPDAIAVADQLTSEAFGPPLGPFNLIGNLVMFGAAPHMTQYASRVSDLEGLRRAALLAAELRRAGVPRGDVSERMADSDVRNPYSGAPLTWDDELGAIVFRGIQPHDRGLHALQY